MSFRNVLLYVTSWMCICGPILLINEFVDSTKFTPNLNTNLSPPEIIKSHGYPEETYYVQTPDKYILQLNRIPHGIQNEEGSHYPILLVHGFIDSSYCFIANGPNRSLAYLLADQGYDVWMINARGNTYSSNHTNYSTTDPEFWNFSFHEIGIYDLPTTIDFILNKTNHRQLFCICMSAGNPKFYIMLSELPEYNDKIIAQISLAPFYHQYDSESIMTPSAPFNLSLSGPILDRNFLMELAIQIASMIELPFSGYNLYDFGLFLTFGLLPDHINREIMPGIYNHYPAGTSLKTSQHLAQFGKSLRKFDYGPKGNLKLYGTTYPPEYNISNIRIPVRIYHAKYDKSAFPEEIQLLHDRLPVKAGVVLISDPLFSHLDFLYNRNVNELVNNDVLTFVNYVIKNSSNSTEKS